MHHDDRRSGKARLPKIIHRPDLQTRRQRGMFALLAGLGWLGWLYLFLPLVTLGGWHFGVDRFQTYVIDSRDHSWASLTLYAVTIALAGTALILWAFYNYRRFRHTDRRRPVEALDAERLALSFGVNSAHVAALQRGRVTTLHHDDHGNIVAMQTPSASTALSSATPPGDPV